jgi:hypothetical protein
MKTILFLSFFISLVVYGCKKDAVSSKSQPEVVSGPSKEDWRMSKLPVHWMWKAKYVDNYLPDTLVNYMVKSSRGC